MSALRAARQLTASVSRLSKPLASSSRLVARIPARTAVASAWTNAPRSAFSTSSRVQKAGSTDLALSQKFEEELKYELEASAEQTDEPEFLKTFKAQGHWTIDNVDGADEVTLVRKFGNEEIRMMFSIADLQSPAEPEFEEEGTEAEQESSEQPLTSYPIRVAFAITKSDAPGAIQVDAMCQEGAFLIENVSYYADAKLGTAVTADADWSRRGLYVGPQFETLDVGLQEEFEKWLQERGINETLALFVPEFCEYKEQKEYVRWLGNMKKFIEA
ncbi:regulatory protein suaprga1 [Punctularia strigosozonata HHB-11173 SS5]|uniref:regulatory protein suaprga1 n=1 Tax=Punctularia strigosozonata (strain HHB-11173) TaxID=741275 RepID=UPI000441865F|nr:regulatory protein suaprga1 [Punctularia strigosozonata HHB-11173 SS5]EIN08552.1 regulatory protein suaprga1 [Punctularia strigosozonata HHB-11173 SS5]